jgi:hypothetical protein
MLASRQRWEWRGWVKYCPNHLPSTLLMTTVPSPHCQCPAWNVSQLQLDAAPFSWLIQWMRAAWVYLRSPLVIHHPKISREDEAPSVPHVRTNHSGKEGQVLEKEGKRQRLSSSYQSRRPLCRWGRRQREQKADFLPSGTWNLRSSNGSQKKLTGQCQPKNWSTRVSQPLGWSTGSVLLPLGPPPAEELNFSYLCFH